MIITNIEIRSIFAIFLVVLLAQKLFRKVCTIKAYKNFKMIKL